jgi:hypothetical protein
VLVRTAETAAEVFSTEHGGAYTHLTPRRLHAIEPTILLTRRAAVREHFAYLIHASGTVERYRVTAEALNDDTFTIERRPQGIVRVGRVCGRHVSW